MVKLSRKTPVIKVTMATLLGLSFLFFGRSAIGQTVHTPPQEPAQSLESKLSKTVTFVSQKESALDQLVEVAQLFQIPMGIEWQDQSDAKKPDLPGLSNEMTATVYDLIGAILLPYPEYQMTVDNGIVHIARQAFAASPKNILNLRIRKYSVKKTNLYEAEALLRAKIDASLHPEDYRSKGGGTSDYGYGVDGIFDVPNVTFSGDNLTFREILDGLTKANGNALWVVNFKSTEISTKEKSTHGASIKTDEQIAPVLYWTFIPLRKA